MALEPFPIEDIPGPRWSTRLRLWFAYVHGKLTNFNSAVSNITVGASPFTTTNSLAGDADVIVQGGTVSKVELKRGGSNYDTGATAGMFLLSPGDSLIVTYTVAPTMRTVPR